MSDVRLLVGILLAVIIGCVLLSVLLYGNLWHITLIGCVMLFGWEYRASLWRILSKYDIIITN